MLVADHEAPLDEVNTRDWFETMNLEPLSSKWINLVSLPLEDGKSNSVHAATAM